MVYDYAAEIFSRNIIHGQMRKINAVDLSFLTTQNAFLKLLSMFLFLKIVLWLSRNFKTGRNIWFCLLIVFRGGCLDLWNCLDPFAWVNVPCELMT